MIIIVLVKHNLKYVKLNENPVCFGSSGDSPGIFKSVRDFDTSYILVSHPDDPTFDCGKHWGCGHENIASVYITNSHKEKLAPPVKDYDLYSRSTRDYRMLLPVSPSRYIKSNEELQVWFKDDFNDENEQASKTTCIDVFAWGNNIFLMF